MKHTLGGESSENMKGVENRQGKCGHNTFEMKTYWSLERVAQSGGGG